MEHHYYFTEHQYYFHETLTHEIIYNTELMEPHRNQVTLTYIKLHTKLKEYCA